MLKEMYKKYNCNKLRRERRKEQRRRFFKGAPAGGVAFVVAMLFFFASVFIVPLYILAVKHGLTYLKIFVVSILVILALGTKIYFDIKIWKDKKDKGETLSIKKDIAIDSLYLFANVYIIVFGLEGIWYRTNKTGKSHLIKEKEIKQTVETTLSTSYSMLIIIVVMLVAVLISIFINRKNRKRKFKSREIKSTRTRVKGRYKYTKSRNR